MITSTQRIQALAFLGLGCALSLAACFNPHQATPGYYCHPTDNPACPEGQVCDNERCVTPGQTVDSTDLLAANLDSGATPADMHHGPVDMKAAPHDGAGPPADLKVVHDLSKSCVATGGDCTYHNNGICCSNYCVYASNTCK